MKKNPKMNNECFFCLIKREWMEGLELDFRVDALILIDVTIEKNS